MKIYMSNIQNIKNIKDLEKKLSESELAQYNKFHNQTRKKQYLVGHALIKDVCNINVKIGENGVPKLDKGFVSIAHKDDLVLVAVSNNKIGLDIENTDIDRDFFAQSELLGLLPTHNKYDFYKEFVRYESKLKFDDDAQQYTQYFYMMNNYIICIMGVDKDIQFIDYDKSFSDVSAIFVPLCTEQNK